jgi:hypothetical protein
MNDLGWTKSYNAASGFNSLSTADIVRVGRKYNAKFVVNNFDYKYTNLRIDMRSGHALIRSGNAHLINLKEAEKEICSLQATIDKLVEAVSALSDDLELSGKHLRDLGHANKQKYCDGQVKEYRDLINSVKESDDD